jgi:hypothetical protein
VTFNYPFYFLGRYIPTYLNNSIPFNSFICALKSTANGQLQSQYEYKTTAIRQHRTKKKGKVNQLRLVKLRRDLLKISINLQIALAADTHLAEVAEGATELGEITMFRVGTRIPTVSRREGQH